VTWLRSARGEPLPYGIDEGHDVSDAILRGIDHPVDRSRRNLRQQDGDIDVTGRASASRK